jgi:hypothetical protein
LIPDPDSWCDSKSFQIDFCGAGHEEGHPQGRRGNGGERTLKAFVKYGRKPYEAGLKEIPVPEPAEDEVPLQVAGCGLCGLSPKVLL